MTDRINLNEDESLDEIVIGSAHLEQMDDNHWFLRPVSRSRTCGQGREGLTCWPVEKAE